MEQRYATLLEEIETLVIEKKSKFICSLMPVQTEEEALSYLASIRKKYYDANHHCSAFIVGLGELALERSSDDKEPSGTAGKPMLEVLKGEGIRNVVAVVSRYFGGTLLGTGGLIKAYTQSVKSSLEKATVIEKICCEMVRIETDYSTLPKIEYEVLQGKQRIHEVIYTDKVTMLLLLEYALTENIKKDLINLTNGQCRLTAEGFYYAAIINNEIQLDKIENNKKQL